MRCRRIAVFLLFLCAVLNLFAVSCWDRREIDELALASTVAVDREGDKTIVTAEFFRPAALSQQTGSGAGVTTAGRQSHLATGSGPTIFRAIEDMSVKLPRELRWAHANNILVGKEMARRRRRVTVLFPRFIPSSKTLPGKARPRFYPFWCSRAVMRHPR